MRHRDDIANIKHLARHKITRENVEEPFANEPAIVDYKFLWQEDRFVLPEGERFG